MKKCKICGHVKTLNMDISLFQAPTAANRLEEWSRAAGSIITANDFVCMKHFENKCVREHHSLDKSGKVIRRTLTPDAVPKLSLGSKSSTYTNSPPDFPSPNCNTVPCKNRQYTKTKIVSNKSMPVKSQKDISQVILPVAPFQNLQIDPSSESPQQELTLNFNNDPINLIELQTSFYNYLNSNNLEILFNILPPEWGVHRSSNSIIISHINNNDSPKIDKAIVIEKIDIKIFINNIYRPLDTKITKLADLRDLVEKMQNINLCNGSGVKNLASRYCNGENIRKKTKSCHPCALLKKYLSEKSKKLNSSTKKSIVQKTKIKNRCLRIKNRQQKQKERIKDLQTKMAKMENMDSLISALPENQKLVVKTCFETAGRGLHGKRYNKDWIYTCILIKIKSPKLYRHLRGRELLPLPAPCTLSKYISNIDSTYGFQNKLFQLIKEKTKCIAEYERHGTLMIDECKITPSKHFDKNRLQVMGFVDLGEYTPSKQKDKLGDHALVFMFQPFAGKNMQALACFLSNGCVTSSVLAKLTLECILLCEAAGLFIDVVTSDGATWNRAMWKIFGAGNPEAPWCIHPCNEDRRLRMCSDFPHLLKCIRNRLVSSREFHVPEGRVRLIHFEILMEYDAKHEFKLAPKLTRKHVNPKNHEKMTTRYAFQLFSATVADSLSILREKNLPGLIDCEPTIEFCKRINQLSDILNSNNCFTALRLNSSQQQELEDFLIYMDLWEACAEPQFFLTKSTAEGLRATISTTLNLLKYCTEELAFKYLMTRRINQDPLEHFFGLLRLSGGANNNSESLQIAQLFRLISLYSLVKPPRGSNVSGGDMLHALVRNTTDLLSYNAKNNTNLTKETVDLHLDKMLNEDIGCGETVEFDDSEEAFAYVCGYISRKHKSEKCQHCVETIIGDGLESFNTFITLRSRGHLIFPSKALVTLLKDVESSISESLKSEIKRNTLLDILDKLGKRKINNFIGCAEHKSELTKKIIFSFLMIRMSFSCQKEARKRSSENANAKRYAKLAKLV